LLSLYPPDFEEAEQITAFTETRLIYSVNQRCGPERRTEAVLCRRSWPRSLDCQHQIDTIRIISRFIL